MNARLLLTLSLIGCGETWTWTAGGDVLGGTGGTDTAVDPSHDLDGDGYAGVAFGGDDCWDDPKSTPDDFEAIAGWEQPFAAEVHPGAAETWYDGVDQDCAGDDDFDQDADGHRSQAHVDGAGASGDDCYDAVDDGLPEGASSCTRTADLSPAEVHPGATDTAYDGVDADCGGDDDFDQDHDGFGRCAECDDTNAEIYPSDALDTWYDGVDSNCDGNDGDQDGDGYYKEGYAFAIPADYQGGDCNDIAGYDPKSLNGFPAVPSTSIHPGAAETWYDGVDADCSGDDDFDQDADGQATNTWPDGAARTGPDCVDTDATIYEGAADAWYDGVDSDCARNDDFDQDGDGYDDGTDCDDLNAAVNPGVAEDCATTADDDCSGSTNDVGAAGCSSFSPDLDGDGYGDLDGAVCLCVATAGFTIPGVTSADTDCDDSDATVNPGEVEVCNDGVDNDCDGGGVGCGLTGTVTTADVVWTGVAAGDEFGAALGSGDVDGDGLIDIVVGAPGRDGTGTDDGAVYAFEAPFTSGKSSLAGQSSIGGGNSAASGSAVAVGDFDGDGVADTVVGEPEDDCDGQDCGQAWILRGPTWPSTVSSAWPDVWEWSRSTSSSSYGGLGVGSSAVVLGDMNGDGTSDVALGAPDVGGGWGGLVFVRTDVPVSSYLWDSTVWLAEGSQDRAGWALGGGQDIDGDGLGDLAVGAPGASSFFGAVYIIYAPASGGLTSLSGADERILASSVSALGWAVALVPDVDGDGRGDLLVGAPTYAGSTGRAYVFYGGTAATGVGAADAVLSGATAGDGFGRSACGPGDLTSDGSNDVAIGADYASGSGAVFLFAGPIAGTLTTSDASATLVPASGAARFGAVLARSGDVDGDGVDDLLVGSPFDDTVASDSGAVYLFYGGGM